MLIDTLIKSDYYFSTVLARNNGDIFVGGGGKINKVLGKDNLELIDSIGTGTVYLAENNDNIVISALSN